jgi:hypothetical protein
MLGYNLHDSQIKEKYWVHLDKYICASLSWIVQKNEFNASRGFLAVMTHNFHDTDHQFEESGLEL